MPFLRFRSFTLLTPTPTATTDIDRKRKREKAAGQPEAVVRTPVQRDRHHQQVEAGGRREVERVDGRDDGGRRLGIRR